MVETGDGKPDNDGAGWHAHWVVLAKDAACKAGLKVKDVAPGTAVKMPATAPGVPLLLDSPEARPALSAAADVHPGRSAAAAARLPRDDRARDDPAAVAAAHEPARAGMAQAVLSGDYGLVGVQRGRNADAGGGGLRSVRRKDLSTIRVVVELGWKRYPLLRLIAARDGSIIFVVDRDPS